MPPIPSVVFDRQRVGKRAHTDAAAQSCHRWDRHRSLAAGALTQEAVAVEARKAARQPCAALDRARTAGQARMFLCLPRHSETGLAKRVIHSTTVDATR